MTRPAKRRQKPPRRPPRSERRHDEEDEAEPAEKRSFVSLGWLYHLGYSVKAHLALLPSMLMGLLLRRRARVVPLRRDPSAVTLVDPHVEAYSNPAQDQAEEIEEEEVEEEAPRKRAKPAPKPVVKRKGGYELPSLALLTAPKATDRLTLSTEAIEENAKALESVLGDFGVRGEIINAHPGPVVTLYELEPAPGIKSSRVIGLADDIARSMSKVSARVAVVPGRNAIGIELPNPKREKVLLRDASASSDYTDTQARLPLCLGKTIGGDPVIVDLARMPHLLIAGTTGSGKSVAINTMILSLMYRLRPDDCRVIMIDPKMLELSVYEGIPHLLTPVVTDPKKAVVALKWAVREMEERYRKMSKLGVRNIDGYNARVTEAKSKGEALCRTVHTGYDKESGEAIYEKEDLELDTIPYIVVIVDEMADLMMVAGKDIEGAIQRLAQMARAAGIHVDPRDAAPLGRRHHRHHQGEFPDPHLVPGHLEDRQPHDSGRAGRRAAARPGRHALHGGRRAHQPRARPVLLRRGSREDRPPPQVAGHAAIPRGGHRQRRAGGGRRGRGRRRVRQFRDGQDQRPLFAGRGHRDARPQSLHQLHPAPAADRL